MARVIRWPSKAKAQEYMVEIACTPDSPVVWFCKDSEFTIPCDSPEGEDGTCITEHGFGEETWAWIKEYFADVVDVLFYESVPEDWVAKRAEG